MYYWDRKVKKYSANTIRLTFARIIIFFIFYNVKRYLYTMPKQGRNAVPGLK